jgi:pSer/pThr/pTyr-binding forkhead associated (FHA) protein
VQLLPGCLEVVSGDPRHKEIRFVRMPGRPAELILGREPGDSPQYVALGSSTVSRRHARLAFTNGQWAVTNLSQTNPLVVNDQELSAKDGCRPLVDGDRLELGEVLLRFHAR